MPLSVARAQVCAPLTDTGGRGIPRQDVVECLRLIKVDDVVFWVSVGLTAGALVAAGGLRFAVRRKYGIGIGNGRAAATTTATEGNGKGGGELLPLPLPSPLAPRCSRPGRGWSPTC